MRKPFTFNISLMRCQLLFFAILFLGTTYLNASNNANQINKSSYDTTNLQAAFSVLKMRIESERESLQNISVSCNEMGTKEQIKKMVQDLEELYNKSLLFSNSFEESLRKDKRDMLQLDIIQSKIAKIRQNSNSNTNIICKTSRESTPDLTKIKKAAKETQHAAEKAKKLLSRMKEIASELYDSLSDTKSLLKQEFKNSVSNILGSQRKCLKSGISFERQVLLGMIPERHLEIEKRFKQAEKLLAEAKVNNYKHTDIYQARHSDYTSSVNNDTPLHIKYKECEDKYSYLNAKCVKLNSNLDQVIKGKYRELLKLLVGIWDLRKDQLIRLKSSVKSMGENVAMIYVSTLDADVCMGNVDLDKITSVNTSETPAVSPELCKCSGGTLEVGSYKNESDCLIDQKIWLGDLVTWSQKNGGTCYRCPEDDVDCGKGLDSNSETLNQPEYVSGTIWDVWGPIPYGYGTKCFTSEDISIRMNPGTKKDKDGWSGRNGGGTMRPTGQSCKKILEDNKPADSPLNGDLDQDKLKNIDPDDPKTAAIIKEWVRLAEPPINATKGAKARYESYGRKVGKLVGGIAKVTHKPDDVAVRTPEQYVWNKRDKLDSVDHCTLAEYVIAKLGNSSIDHCHGRYKPKVIDVAGMSKKQAEKKIKAIGLKTKITLGDPAFTKKDGLTVQKTIPSVDTTVERGSKVTLVVHPPFVDKRIVPDISGITKKEVIKKIRDAGLVPKINTVKASSSNQSGKVSSVRPTTGTQMIAGRIVFVDVFDTYEDKHKTQQINGTLWDWWGPIPYGYGKKCLTQEEVNAYMKPGAKPKKNGWYARKKGGTMKPTGKSCQKPGEARKPSGEGTVIFVDTAEDFGGKRDKHIEVLNVIGMSIKQAAEKIKALGLKPAFKLGESTQDRSKGNTVKSQDPKPGTKLKKGSKVKLFVYRLKPENRQNISKPNWDNGCYNGKNTGGATLQWTLRDPPPYSGLTPICSDRDGEVWILKNHISEIINGKQDRHGCYLKSIVKAKNRDYRGTLCRPKGYRESISSSNNEQNQKVGQKNQQKNYPLAGGVPYLDVPRKILSLPLLETYFLSEWSVSKTFKGGHLARPLSDDIDTQLFKEMGTHMVGFSYEVSYVNGLNPFGMVLIYFWLEPNDPIMEDKMQKYMRLLCSKKNKYIREVKNSKGEVVRKDLAVYSPNTWSGVFISIPRQLFAKEDYLNKTISDLLPQLEPYVKQCK